MSVNSHWLRLDTSFQADRDTEWNPLKDKETNQYKTARKLKFQLQVTQGKDNGVSGNLGDLYKKTANDLQVQIQSLAESQNSALI